MEGMKKLTASAPDMLWPCVPFIAELMSLQLTDAFSSAPRASSADFNSSTEQALLRAP